MVTRTITVTGMNCAHCAASVTEELTALPGVREVAVDLPTGRVEVSSDAALPTGDVHRAICEAGFEVLLPVSG